MARKIDAQYFFLYHCNDSKLNGDFVLDAFHKPLRLYMGKKEGGQKLNMVTSPLSISTLVSQFWTHISKGSVTVSSLFSLILGAILPILHDAITAIFLRHETGFVFLCFKSLNISTYTAAFIERVIWFLSFVLLLCCITLIDLQVLNHPCSPGVNPT